MAVFTSGEIIIGRKCLLRNELIDREIDLEGRKKERNFSKDGLMINQCTTCSASPLLFPLLVV